MLRPGDSLTIPYDGFVNGLQVIRFLSFLPSKLRGLWLLPRKDLLLLNTPALAGRTDVEVGDLAPVVPKDDEAV